MASYRMTSAEFEDARAKAAQATELVYRQFEVIRIGSRTVPPYLTPEPFARKMTAALRDELVDLGWPARQYGRKIGGVVMHTHIRTEYLNEELVIDPTWQGFNVKPDATKPLLVARYKELGRAIRGSVSREFLDMWTKAEELRP